MFPDGNLTASTVPSELYLLNDLITIVSKHFTDDAKLPNTDLPTDQALANFDEILSPWEFPLEWINADANHVQSIAKDVVEMTHNDEIEVATLLRPAMIYQVSGNRQ
jgi:hypothetical protein